MWNVGYENVYVKPVDKQSATQGTVEPKRKMDEWKVINHCFTWVKL